MAKSPLIEISKVISVGVLAVTLISVTGLSPNVLKPGFEESKLKELRGAFSAMNSLLKVDSMRRARVSKIKRVINKYNRRLSSEEKYEIANEIYEMSLKYDNLDVNLICATITHESAFTWRKDITSPAGAMGLMQIMPYTGYVLSKNEKINWTTPEDILYDPILNVRMGCRYLSTLIDMYHVDGGLAAYNGGETRAAKWLASGRDDEVLFEETREYVPAILELYNNYKN